MSESFLVTLRQEQFLRIADAPRHTREVKVDVRTLEGELMTADAAVLPVGSNLRIAPAFAAIATEGEGATETRVEARYIAAEGRYVVSSVAVRATDDRTEINANALRRVTVQAIVQEAAPHCIALTLGDDPRAKRLTVADLTTQQGRLIPDWLAADVVKRGPNAARMDTIEIIYGVHALAGSAPVQAIARELDVPHRTASDWTRKARAAGRLDGMNYSVGRQADG